MRKDGPVGDKFQLGRNGKCWVPLCVRATLDDGEEPEETEERIEYLPHE